MPGLEVSLQAIGIKPAVNLFTQAERELKQGTRDRLKQAAVLIHGIAKKRTHSARVQKAMSYDVEVKSSSEWRARIGPSRKKAFFAHFLEFGTKHSRAFPFLLPTKRQVADRVVQLVGVPPSLKQRK